ncbi:6-bladed beta-propeller [Paraprevotella xylaniphila]|nr:6-bladed beta-propeller [Paraprevotella xylaniphila]
MKTNIKKYFAIGVSWFLFTFCSNSPKNTFLSNYYIENDSIPSLFLGNMEEGGILNYSDIYDTLSFVKLETNPEALIGRVSKVEILKNGDFLIFDNANAGIFVFSSKGTFLNFIGHRGNGEKEYITPEDVVYDTYNDEIIVWDHNKMHLMFFHTDGKYIRKIKLPWYIGTLQVLDKEHIVVFMNHGDDIEHGYGYNIKVLDRDGVLVSEGLPYSEQFGTFNPACKMAFSVYNDTLFCNPPYSSIVYEVTKDSVLPRYFLDFGDCAIPKEWFGHMDNREMNQRLGHNPDLAYCGSFHEATNYFLLNIVKNRMVNIGLYPKQRNIESLYASFLWNDLYGLVSSNVIQTVRGNKVVSVLYADQFEPYQEVLEKESNSEVVRKNIVDKLYGTTFMSLFSKNNVAEKVREHIMSSRFEITSEERSFIQGIKRSDNPILQIGILK